MISPALIAAESLRDYCRVMQEDADRMLRDMLADQDPDIKADPILRAYFEGFADGVTTVTKMLHGASEAAGAVAEQLASQ